MVIQAYGYETGTNDTTCAVNECELEREREREREEDAYYANLAPI